ncbi:site-specific integrase [Pseudooctadecabacter jejudonensis]|nr:site-specific integrase [Pseudooctadecabacter jejudonensis]
MFPDAFEDEARIGDEAPNSILSSREDITESVDTWLERIQYEGDLLPAEHETLIDHCIDEYLTGNPELSNGWKEVLSDAGVEDAHWLPDYLSVVTRPNRTPKRRRLTSIYPKYVKAKEIGPSAENDFGIGIRRFVELHGDLDVASIDRRHVEEFRDMLRRMPSRPPNNIRILPMPDQVVWAEGLDIPRFSQATINKNIGGVKVTLQYAFEETSEIDNRDWRNPCDGFSKKPKKKSKRIIAFTPGQIETIFSSKVYQPKSPEKFWIPLILYHTGARLDEISQLHVKDVRYDPLPFIVCENLYDEDPAIAKKVKSMSANRTIPIHRNLVEIGFLDYVNAVASTGSTHLFPNLPHHNGGKRGNSVSRSFIRSFRNYGQSDPETGLDSKQLVTHSLRHTFRKAGFRGKLDQEFVQVVMGHFVGGVSWEEYGDDIYQMPDVLAERVMNDIQLPPIDMDFMKSEADRYLERARNSQTS